MAASGTFNARNMCSKIVTKVSFLAVGFSLVFADVNMKKFESQVEIDNSTTSVLAADQSALDAVDSSTSPALPLSNNHEVSTPVNESTHSNGSTKAKSEASKEFERKLTNFLKIYKFIFRAKRPEWFVFRTAERAKTLIQQPSTRKSTGSCWKDNRFFVRYHGSRCSRPGLIGNHIARLKASNS